MANNSTDYENKWSDDSVNELMRMRPLGVTLLAILQIIGTLIIIGVLVAIPILLEGKTAQVLGEPIFYLLIIYAIIMIPVSFFLAYGLLKGRDWARFYTRLFQIINIISSLLCLNIIGIIIPIYIFFYLNKPHATKYFDSKVALSSKYWVFGIVGFIFLLILSSSLAVYTNPIVQQTIIESKLSSLESNLIGMWENPDGTIYMTFSYNHTCTAKKDNITYNGTWEINKYFYYIEVSWHPIVFQLPHPNNLNSLYPIEQIDFMNGGQNLQLYTCFDPYPNYMLHKIM